MGESTGGNFSWWVGDELVGVSPPIPPVGKSLYTYHILQNFWSMYEHVWTTFKTFSCCKFKTFIPLYHIFIPFIPTISSSGKICGMNLEKAVLLVSLSPELLSLGYSAYGLLSVSICLCGSSLLIRFPLNCKRNSIN